MQIHKELITKIQKKKAVIAVIGLGYVGLPIAVEFGNKYETIGFDIDQDRINELKNGNDKTLEISKNNIQKSDFNDITDFGGTHSPNDVDNIWSYYWSYC